MDAGFFCRAIFMRFTLCPDGPRRIGPKDSVLEQVGCKGMKIDVDAWIVWIRAYRGKPRLSKL